MKNLTRFEQVVGILGLMQETKGNASFYTCVLPAFPVDEKSGSMWDADAILVKCMPAFDPRALWRWQIVLSNWICFQVTLK